MVKKSEPVIGIIIVFCLLVSLGFVSADYSSSLTPRYINRTVSTQINISITSGVNGSEANITTVNITLPSTLSFVAGTNETTATQGSPFTNTSTNLIFNTSANGFPNGTTNYFLFNVTSQIAGDSSVVVVATRADANANSSTLTVTTNFDFSGFVLNATGGNESNVNVSIYQFAVSPTGPPSEILEANTLTNANGSFNFLSLNGSATNYKLKMVRYGDSGSACVCSNATCNATMTGTVLPAFPSVIYYPRGGNDMSLNGSNFYLQAAATLRLYAWGYNTTNSLVQQRFGYEVIDQKVGFPVESNIRQNVSTIDIVVPSGRDYSVMFIREMSQFTNYGNVCNGSTYNDTACATPPISNSSLGTISANQILVVNQSLVISKYRLYGCINIASGHNNTSLNVTNIKLKMIPFTTSSGFFVPPMNADQGDINLSDTTQLNNTNYSGGVQCPSTSIAAYNISVLGSNSGITYFVEMFAKNSTNESGVHVGGNYLASFQNITITDHTNLNLTLYKLAGSYVNDSTNKYDSNTSVMKINIVNDTQGLVTTSMHVEVAVKNSNTDVGTAHYMIETITNGTFYLPILNNSNWAEVSVFPNDGPPMVKKINLSVSENNITLVTIDFAAGGDKGIRQMNASGQLETVDVSTMSFQLRFLRRGTNDVITEMNASSFNPLKALVAGSIDLEIKVVATNVTMKFNNFDMFSAKQPPMFAIMDNESLASSSQTWQFGNFVPKNVYDNVTLIIPYDDSVVDESWSYSMAIPVLYKEDESTTHQFEAGWNISAGYTTANLTDEFIEYNNSRYRDYLTSDGVSCSDSDSDSVCYMNETGNQIQMEIPHFTGLEGSISGSAPAAGAVTTGGGGVGTAFWKKTITITEEEFEEGYTKELEEKHRLKVKINESYHYVGVVELTSTTVTINVSSEPQQATLAIGDLRKFDVTEDSWYDLSVKLNSISDNKADITIKSIREKVTEEPGAADTTREIVEEEEEEKASLMWLWVTLIIIVVVVVVVFYFLKRKK